MARFRIKNLSPSTQTHHFPRLELGARVLGEPHGRRDAVGGLRDVGQRVAGEGGAEGLRASFVFWGWGEGVKVGVNAPTVSELLPHRVAVGGRAAGAGRGVCGGARLAMSVFVFEREGPRPGADPWRLRPSSRRSPSNQSAAAASQGPRAGRAALRSGGHSAARVLIPGGLGHRVAHALSSHTRTDARGRQGDQRHDESASRH